jgi:hypothetical protein
VGLVFVPCYREFWNSLGNAVKIVHQLIFQSDMIQELTKFQGIENGRYRNS